MLVHCKKQLKGSEQIFIHAEKDVDMLVKNDWRETIDNDEHHSVDKESFTKVGKDYHQAVDKQHNLSVGKSHSRQAGKDTHIKAGKNYIAQAQEIHLKAGMQLVIESGTEVVMKAGSGLIALNPSGVTIKGAMVKINSGGGGGAAKAASPEAPAAPQPPKDDKSGKVSKAAKAKQQKYDAIALASGSANAVQADEVALASVVRGPNVVSNAPLPPEQKTAEIECVRPDGSPAKDFPYHAILADGSEKTGTLDANGKASLQGVPKGSVQVTVGETVAASEVVQLRQEMTQIFQAMIAKEKADASTLADNRSDQNILQDAMEMDFSVKKGIWKGAVGLLTWMQDVKDVVHPVNILHRKLIVAWKSYSSDSDEWAATYKKNIEIADHKELVEALGFDPDKVTAEVIAEAYEITGYLFDDEASRTLIKQFAKDFALAQDRTEWAEFAGGAIFEIVLSAVIVALTGGLGAAAVAAKSTRHVDKLAELGKVLKKLADKLKAVKLRKVKTGHTGEAVKVKLDKPSEVEFSSHGQDVDVGSKNTDMMSELDVVPDSHIGTSLHPNELSKLSVLDRADNEIYRYLGNTQNGCVLGTCSLARTQFDRLSDIGNGRNLDYIRDTYTTFDEAADAARVSIDPRTFMVMENIGDMRRVRQVYKENGISVGSDLGVTTLKSSNPGLYLTRELLTDGNYHVNLMRINNKGNVRIYNTNQGSRISVDDLYSGQQVEVFKLEDLSNK